MSVKTLFSWTFLGSPREVLLAYADPAQKLFLLRVETEKICLETVSTQKEFQLAVERANAEMIFPVAESM